MRGSLEGERLSILQEDMSFNISEESERGIWSGGACCGLPSHHG